MYKNLFDEFDNIKTPESAVNKAILKARDHINKAENGNEKLTKDSGIRPCRPKRKLAAGLLAACFALVLVFGAYFGFASDSTISQPSSKGFIITANAYEAKKLGEKADSAVIGAYTGELSGGWAMYFNLEKDMDFSPNFFQSYVFSNFTIEGQGIESVTFRTDKEGTYFALSPAGIYLNADEDKAQKQVEDALKNYSDMSLSNSQYSEKELKDYSDGLSFGNMHCDEFTFTNAKGSDKIDFSNKLEFVLESNHNNPEISKKLDRLWECEEEIKEYQSEKLFEGGALSDREEELYRELDTLAEEIRQLILKDATIEIEVSFTNGSTLVKYLDVDLVRVDNTLWLTLSENN